MSYCCYGNKTPFCQYFSGRAKAHQSALFPHATLCFHLVMPRITLLGLINRLFIELGGEVDVRIFLVPEFLDHWFFRAAGQVMQASALYLRRIYRREQEP